MEKAAQRRPEPATCLEVTSIRFQIMAMLVIRACIAGLLICVRMIDLLEGSAGVFAEPEPNIQVPVLPVVFPSRSPCPSG
jgi:hypothetical protein